MKTTLINPDLIYILFTLPVHTTVYTQAVVTLIQSVNVDAK